jgi:excisionase family DNA binding protein
MTKKSRKQVLATAARERRRATGKTTFDAAGGERAGPKPKSPIGTGPRLLYSRREVAALLGISTRTVERLQASGLLRAVKLLQGKTLYAAEDVHRLAQPGGPSSPPLFTLGEKRQ